MAIDGVPVTVTCRVLNLCRQQYYRWVSQPFTDGQLGEARLTNAIFDAHTDDPEFGYRFLADEVRSVDHVVSDRVVWRICRDMGWWSRFGKPKRGKSPKPRMPSHDDLVRRNFTADAPNVVWVTDITEHLTDQGKVYCCAIKDLFSNRIVGWAIDSPDESPAGGSHSRMLNRWLPERQRRVRATSAYRGASCARWSRSVDPR